MKKFFFFLFLVLIIIQFIQVEKTNPPVTNDTNWNSKITLDYAKRACYDCHSNETNWPWYSHIAPASWLIAHDVNEGREHLNFSTGNLKEADESVDEILEEHMPPKIYLILHPEAKLGDEEKAVFMDGLKKTFGEKKEGKENKASNIEIK